MYTCTEIYLHIYLLIIIALGFMVIVRHGETRRPSETAKRDGGQANRRDGALPKWFGRRLWLAQAPPAAGSGAKQH